MTAIVDLAPYAGETWVYDFECNDSDGVALNITGATIKFKVATDTGSVLTATVGDGITITSGASGLCTVMITPTMQDSAGIANGGSYKWELWVQTADTKVSVQAAGNLEAQFSLVEAYP